MRLPSMAQVLGDAGRTGARFPLVILAAIVAAIGAVIAIGQREPVAAVRVMMSAQLGIPLLLALALTGERLGRLTLPLSLGGVVLLVVHYLLTPDPGRAAAVVRFVQFNVVAHLLVAFLPHVGRGEENGFWQYNKTLFLRLLGSVIFVGVLIAGLDVALLALDKLFGVPIDDLIYGRLNVALLFVFTTWYFLGGVPRDFAGLERSDDYPRGLRVFAQYILSPLVAVYLALLTAYLVKVIVTAEWPSGWIGWLVTSVAAAGLLSLALLRPLADRPGFGWISRYSRAYFILMLPAVIMQMMAIGKRIGQYGFTENRYFICILALWLLGVSALGALGRLRSLKPLPLTLCVLALITSLGPWGAFAVSRSSQVGRLETILVGGGMLEGGNFTPVDDVDHETRREISAILDYLMEYHGPGAIDQWLTTEQGDEVAAAADSLLARHRHRDLSRQVMGYLDLEHVTHWQRPADQGWFVIERSSGGAGVPLAGYEWVHPVNFPGDRGSHIELGDRSIRLDQNDAVVTLSRDGGPSIEMQLGPVLDQLEAHARTTLDWTAPDAQLGVEGAAGMLRARLQITSIRWHKSDEGRQIRHLAGLLLLGTGP